MIRNLCVLGSTGSIGTQTLDVVDNNSDELHVLSMTAGDNLERFLGQIVKYTPQKVSVRSEEGAAQLKNMLL